MPRGKYKRNKTAKADTSTARDALNERNSSEPVKSFTPVMVRDKVKTIDYQARRIAELEGEVKRLRLLLDSAVRGTV
jgi:hypothetical protein